MSSLRTASAPFFYKHMMFAALAAVALSGCGKSTDEKHADMIKCSGFALGMMNMRQGSPLTVAAEAALRRQGITANDTMPMAAAGQRYANTMDPAKVTRLSQEGAAAAMDLIRKNDADGIAGFLKDCVSTYKDLGQ